MDLDNLTLERCVATVTLERAANAITRLPCDRRATARAPGGVLTVVGSIIGFRAWAPVRHLERILGNEHWLRIRDRNAMKRPGGQVFLCIHFDHCCDAWFIDLNRFMRALSTLCHPCVRNGRRKPDLIADDNEAARSGRWQRRW